jgi:hypothetical protein
MPHNDKLKRAIANMATEPFKQGQAILDGSLSYDYYRYAELEGRVKVTVAGEVREFRIRVSEFL